MHDHSNCDHHRPASYRGAFFFGIILNLTFVIGEIAFGVANKSLSLLADAGHNFGDVLGLAMGWAAVLLAARPATPRRTYGYRRSSILAAVGNSFLLMAGVGAVGWEAIQRLSEPVPVPGGVVMGVAAVGIFVNGGTALMFLRGRKDDINREAAYAHMLTDAVVAAGVVVAGLVMRMTHLAWIDPVCGFVIALLVAISSWRLLRRSLDLAMDVVPDNIDPEQVRDYLANLRGVESVSDLHIWPISTTETALTAHLTVPSGFESGYLADVEHNILHEFGIGHCTIQVNETSDSDGCVLFHDHVH